MIGANDFLGPLLATLWLGVAATAVMDLWGFLRRPLFGLPRADYAFVGRWFGHMPAGRFRHDAIAAAPPIPRERLLGWTIHYLIGTTFAAILVAGWGIEWIARPTLAPPLLVGLGTLFGPLLLMQPGMGAGIAGSRTPRPWVTRGQAVLTHTIYGLGLYAAGWAAHFIIHT